MANRKITDLTALAAGSQATGDLLPIVDVSESAAVDKNKKITVENLFKGIPGSVGIGTSTPGSKLHVAGNARVGSTTGNVSLEIGNGATENRNAFIDLVGDTTYTDHGLRIIRTNGGANAASSLIHRGTSGLNLIAQDAGVVRFLTNNTERVRVTADGNVGIGTTSPSTLLHLQSSEPKLQLQDSDGTNQFSLLRQSTNALYYDGRNGSGAGNHLWRLWNGSAFIEKMRLASNGSFGIGTSNPTSKLHVKVDGTSQTIQTWQNDLGTNDRTINLKGPTTDSATEPFTFQTGNSIAFEIDTTERLKIGAAGDITANSTQLYFGETNSTTNEINIGNGRTTNGYAVIDLIGDATYATYGLRVIRQNTGANANSDIAHRGTGNLSLNAIDAGQVVLSQNNTARLFLRSSDGKVILTGSSGARGGTGTVITSTDDSVGSAVRANGYIEWQTNAGAVGTNYFLSDQTLKENIVNASATASDVINSISFKEFDWKAEAGRTDHVDIGVVAQQVAEVEPGLTMTLSDGKMSINEPAFMTYTAKALQEALAEIETLKAKVAALEAQ